MTTLRPLNCVDRLLVSGSAPTGGRARAPRNPGRLGASRVACASLIPGGASCSGREAGAYSFPKGGLGRLTWQRSRDNGGPRALKKEEEQEAELSVEEVDVGVKKGNHDVGPVVTGEGGKVAAVGWRTLVSLCTLSSVICTIDRAAMSVAILPMADEYSWSEGVKGAVSSAFFAGYTLTNFSGGYLTALFPAASLLGVGVLLWSGFTVLTPAAAATRSMPALFSTRAAMGIAEGVAFPSYTALYAKHMPKEKRSVAQALLYSGQQLGTIIALLTAPKVVHPQ